MSARSLSRDLRSTLWAIVRRRDRIAHLLKLGPRHLSFLARFLTRIIPQSLDELAVLARRAERIPHAALREQALSSITEKAYHVQGGCVFATFLPAAAAKRHIKIVAALETIYDYLDNLCDRLEGVTVEAYPTLHEALLDAVDLDRVPGEYYRDGPDADDGGYLRGLVDDVRAGLADLPQYRRVRSELCTAVALYRDLQSKKHMPADLRDDYCRTWFAQSDERFAHLRWYEFAAACGSSLPVFAMLALAEDAVLDDSLVADTFRAYLPGISSLHIMLDYFIDQAEDTEHGELNFVACYESSDDATQRLSLLIRDAQARICRLPTHTHHEFILEAMRGFYLTHPKVFSQSLGEQSSALLAVHF